MSLIDKWVAMRAVQGIDSVATLRDGDPVIRMSAVEHVLENLPETEPDTTTHDSISAETGKNDGDRTSGDCISRQQAIEIVERYNKSHMVLKQQPMLGAASIVIELEELPSAQPEHKTGRWIPDNTDYYRTKFICSACGESEEVPTTGFGYGTMWDYCPICGAKMEGGE